MERRGFGKGFRERDALGASCRTNKFTPGRVKIMFS